MSRRQPRLSKLKLAFEAGMPFTSWPADTRLNFFHSEMDFHVFQVLFHPPYVQFTSTSNTEGEEVMQVYSVKQVLKYCSLKYFSQNVLTGPVTSGHWWKTFSPQRTFSPFGCQIVAPFHSNKNSCWTVFWPSAHAVCPCSFGWHHTFRRALLGSGIFLQIWNFHKLRIHNI